LLRGSRPAYGGILLSKAFIRHLIQNSWGRFIALNTECTMQASKQSAYVSGKRGMDGLLRVLAREVGRYNITVNQVAPGWIRTEKGRHRPCRTGATVPSSPWADKASRAMWRTWWHSSRRI
jgi:NAD(P)-dependent dehydrogenase (short-subunit alcohol dehydrogenase family)